MTCGYVSLRHAGEYVIAHSSTRSAFVALPLLLVLGACGESPAPEAAPPFADTLAETVRPPVRDSALDAALAAVVAGFDGEVGIHAYFPDSRRFAAFNDDRRFVLASVYKLAVAYAALGGGLRPTDTLEVTVGDLAPGETPLRAGARATVAQLVERSLAHSDNTASDVLLRTLGGPGEVMRQLTALGIRDLTVDRSMREVFADWRGIPERDGLQAWTLSEFESRSAGVAAAARAEAQAAFADDERDAGTAKAVAELLAAIHAGIGLDDAGRELMSSSLRRSDTGPNRIRAGVPPGTVVADKTGTLGPLTHDAGIITLPGGLGDVVLVVLVRSNAPVAARERIIAAAARAVWEHATADARTVPAP